MTQLLIKIFIKNHTEISIPRVRQSYGYLSGGTGMVSNILLFALKMILGIMTNSIAVLADAFNNLTDFASSIMTLVGFWTASKPADKEHPFGHGRSEYVAALVVSILVIIVGLQFARSSVERILDPKPLVYSMVSIVLLVASILVKVWLAFFYRHIGRLIDSKVMQAATMDSLGDVVTTGIVVVGLVLGPYIPFPFDGYVGFVVALFIMWNGWQLVMETLSPLMGEAPSDEFVEDILSRVRSYEGVLDVHDLIVHNYGPGRTLVSLHAEVPAELGIIDAHELIDIMEKEIATQMQIHIVVHMDPVNCDDEEVKEARELVTTIMTEIHPNLSLHDFRIVGQKSYKNLIFDLVVPAEMSEKEAEQVCLSLRNTIRVAQPGYDAVIHMEREFSMLK